MLEICIENNSPLSDKSNSAHSEQIENEEEVLRHLVEVGYNECT